MQADISIMVEVPTKAVDILKWLWEMDTTPDKLWEILQKDCWPLPLGQACVMLAVLEEENCEVTCGMVNKRLSRDVSTSTYNSLVLKGWIAKSGPAHGTGYVIRFARLEEAMAMRRRIEKRMARAIARVKENSKLK